MGKIDYVISWHFKPTLAPLKAREVKLIKPVSYTDLANAIEMFGKYGIAEKR